MRRTLGALGLVLLVACSNVRDRELPALTDGSGIATILGKLSDDEKALVTGYMMRRAVAPASFPEKVTVAEAIAAQREFVAGAQAPSPPPGAFPVPNTRSEADALRLALSASYDSMQTGRDSSGGSAPAAQVRVFNQASKDVAKAIGEMVIRDSSGSIVLRAPVRWRFDEPFKAGEGSIFGVPLPANLDGARVDADLRNGKLTLTLVMGWIEFVDGRSLGRPPAMPVAARPSQNYRAPIGAFGDGVWEVGVDILPGKYKTSGGEGCYWAKVAHNEEILKNHLSDGPATVTIDRSVPKFESKRCGTWERVGD